MNEMFEHVADERWALAEILRVLKPGGILVLISPNRWFPIEGHYHHCRVEGDRPRAFDPVVTGTGDAQLDCSSKLLAE